MNLDQNQSYLKATLKEALLDLNARSSAPKSTVEIVRDSKVIEAVLLLLDRVDKLEGKQ